MLNIVNKELYKDNGNPLVLWQIYTPSQLYLLGYYVIQKALDDVIMSR